MTEAINNPNVLAAMAYKNNVKPESRLVIPVKTEEGKMIGMLSCLDHGAVADLGIVADLTAWRKKFMRFFLTQFEATEARTRAWLNDIVIPSIDRLLFTICLPDGQRVGNFAMCNMTDDSGELDNLIRGRKGGEPRLIYYCELALLSWMFLFLGYRSANLHVFSNNHPTIRLHTSVGFEVVKHIPLTQRQSSGQVEYLLNNPEG
ncbi:MAG: GNAT family N-acetyltransferase, partial [Methylococcus sp.]